MAGVLRDPAFYRGILTWLNPWAIDQVLQQETKAPDGGSGRQLRQQEQPPQNQATAQAEPPPGLLPRPYPLPANAANDAGPPVTIESFNDLLLKAIERRATHQQITTEVQAYEHALQQTCAYEEDKGPFTQFLIDQSDVEASLKPLAKCYKRYVGDAQTRSTMLLFDRDTAEQRLQEATRALKKALDQIHVQTPAFIDLLNPGNLADPERYSSTRNEIMTALKKQYSHRLGLSEAEAARDQARESYMKFNSRPPVSPRGTDANAVAARREKLHTQLEQSRKERQNWRIAEKRLQLFQQNQIQREKELIDGPVTDWLRSNSLIPLYPILPDPPAEVPPPAAGADSTDSSDSDASDPNHKPVDKVPAGFKVFVPPVEEGPEESQEMQDLNAARQALRASRREFRSYKTWWLHQVAEHMWAHPETTLDKFEDDWPQVHSEDPAMMLMDLEWRLVDRAKEFEGLGGAEAVDVAYADLIRVDPSLNSYAGDDEDDDLSVRPDWDWLYDSSNVYRSVENVKRWAGDAASEAEPLAGPEGTPDPAYRDEAARPPGSGGMAGPASKGKAKSRSASPAADAHGTAGPASKGKGKAIAKSPASTGRRDARRTRIREIASKLRGDGWDVTDFDAHWKKVDKEAGGD